MWFSLCIDSARMYSAGTRSSEAFAFLTLSRPRYARCTLKATIIYRFSDSLASQSSEALIPASFLGQLNDRWAVRLVAAWWPPAGTEAFIDAPLRILWKAVHQSDPHKYSGVTGLRLTDSTLEEAFLPEFRGSLPEKWTMHLTRVIAPFPLKEELSYSQDVWVEKLFSAAPSLVQLGFQVTNGELDCNEPAAVESILRCLLMRKTGEGDSDALQLSHLCMQVVCIPFVETFKSSMQSLISRIDDNRFTIWIDERVQKNMGITEREEVLDNDLDVLDMRARWDFWAPEDRPEVIVYHVSR